PSGRRWSVETGHGVFLAHSLLRAEILQAQNECATLPHTPCGDLWQGRAERKSPTRGTTMLKKIHHIGIVVRNLEEAFGFYKDTLGLPLSKMATVQDQGVKAALLPIGESEIELLEPITPDSGVARFLEKKGGGLHHLCFETDDVAAELQGAKDKGLKVIDQKPRPGLAGIIAFLHPQACCSVLVEYAQPVNHSEHSSLLGEARSRRFTAKRLDHVVIAVNDLEGSVATYQKNFGLSREEPHDIPA